MTARYLADTSVLTRMPKPAVAGVVEPLILDGAVTDQGAEWVVARGSVD